MKLKMIKMSSIAAALVLGCGISSAGQAAVVIVTHAPPPPPPANCVWHPRNNTVVCYRGGVSRVFYPVSHHKVCFPEGCYWQNCYHTYYGTECHRLY